jgi:hypothetical protein
MEFGSAFRRIRLSACRSKSRVIEACGREIISSMVTAIH